MAQTSFLIQRAESLLSKACLDDHIFYPWILTLISYSTFACQQMENMVSMFSEDDGSQAYSKADYQQLLDLNLSNLPPNQYSQQIRKIRNQQMFRLLLRQLSGLATIEETLACWSDFADAAILHVIGFASEQVSQKHGLPMTSQTQPAYLIPLAMGKLGGKELNFSSDIDLIFIFSQGGDTNGSASISNQEFFIKVVQLFSQIMQQKSQAGIVFRVDLRLRPHGDNGVLVPSMASCETYFQEQGRDWERYAMVKARIIDSSLPQNIQKNIDNMITPFVYRRYVDFSVIESLRGMKSLIEKEIELNPRLDDIKRGSGGIREIEFIVQSVQIIRGGRLPQIRAQSTLSALALLKKHRLLERSDAIRQCYLFFRSLENLIQIKGDHQSHTLPTDNNSLILLADLMSFDGLDLFKRKLEQYQRIVRQIFSSVLGKQPSFEDDHRLVLKQIESLWQGQIEDEMATNLLASLNYDEPKRCFHLLNDFRQSHRVKRLGQLSRGRLARLMVLIITDLTGYPNQAVITLRMIQLLENIVGRSTYLALLTENPHAIKTLVDCIANSEFIAKMMVQHPFLLEALLEKELGSMRLPNRNLLKTSLNDHLECAENEERKIEIVKQFKLENWLLVARTMLHQSLPVLRVGRFLADIAQVIVEKLVEFAIGQLQEKHPRITRLSASFTILCYGKAGSRELNFDSDLDLVFIHHFPRKDENLAIRLSQRLIHMLTTRSQTGVLYDVDTRLRPSGSAGLLVTHWNAFEKYQQNQAWIWEHQALLKARVMCGRSRDRTRLLALKRAIVSMPRDKQMIRKSVAEMRQKVGYESMEKKDIKKSPGGLLDIEFIVQFLVLSSGEANMAKYTHILTLIQQLHEKEIISREHYSLLKSGWQKAHRVLLNQSIGIKKKRQSYPFADISEFYHSLLKV